MNNNLLKMQFYALSRLNLNASPQLIQSELKDLYGNTNAPSLSTIINWLNNFRAQSITLDAINLTNESNTKSRKSNMNDSNNNSISLYESNFNSLIEEYKLQIKKLIDDCQQKDNLILNENEKIKNLNNEIRDLNLANLGLKEELNTLKLKQFFQDNKSNERQKESKLQEKNEKLEQQLNELNLKHSDEITKNKSLTDQIGKLIEKVKRLEKDVTKTKSELKLKKDEASQLIDENLKLKNELLEDKLVHEKLLNEKSNLVESVKQLHARIVDFETSLKMNPVYSRQLEQDFHKCKILFVDELRSIAQERVIHEQTVNSLRSEVEMCKKEINEKDHLYFETRTQMIKLTEEIARIKGKYVALDFTDFNLSNSKHNSK